MTAERLQHFAQTINLIKDQVTMIFITHQKSHGWKVAEVVNMGQHSMEVSLVKEMI